MTATETTITLLRDDWIRFQIQDKRVLEGFVQEISPDGRRIKVGKAPDWPENEWHNLADIQIIGHQTLLATVDED